MRKAKTQARENSEVEKFHKKTSFSDGLLIAYYERTALLHLGPLKQG